MDFLPDGGGFSGAGIPQSFPESIISYDNWADAPTDPSIWATEDEYRSSEPPNKKSRTSQTLDSNRSKAIGRMFYKTKLCCKFRAGVCPYITNCNFAHGLEELRKPPPNWQEIVASHDEDSKSGTIEDREEHQIPTISVSDSRNEVQRSYKGRHCKKFYTEEGCPYGDSCTFLHDEQSRARESVAISVSPSVGGGGGGGGGYGVGGGVGVGAQTQKPSNWKTRICNKWETTGTCPFGSKCHFAHGLAELHKFGDGFEGEPMPTDSKQAGMATRGPDMSSSGTAASTLPVPRQDFHHMGVGISLQSQSQRTCSVVIQSQVAGQRALQKWKGPDKISRIYGDWIDDIM